MKQDGTRVAAKMPRIANLGAPSSPAACILAENPALRASSKPCAAPNWHSADFWNRTGNVPYSGEACAGVTYSCVTVVGEMLAFCLAN